VVAQQKPEDLAPRPGRVGLVLFIGVMVLIALAGWGLYSRSLASEDLRKTTEEEATPSVLVGKAKRGPETETIVLPGTVQAYVEAPIYARTNGYLKAWYTDIGSPVKAGTLLAEIDTPDVDDQLRQAEADLATAEANNALAQSTARRWRSLLKTNSVSAQETDEKIGDAAAKQAGVSAASANVARLKQLQDYKRVVAPFDGVVTARTTDVGALISAGTGSVLFRVADTSRLRVYVQVPQTYSAVAHIGMEVDLGFAEHAGQIFKAKLVRTSQALDPSSRTLLVELALDNQNGVLMPGGYTKVSLVLPAVSAAAVRLPVSALLFRSDGLKIGVVDTAEAGATAKVKLLPITIGRDFGTEVEVPSGVVADQNIVTNPPDSLIDGETVKVAAPPKQNGKNS